MREDYSDNGNAWDYFSHDHRDMHLVWADTIAVGCALLGFNALSAVRRHLGEGRLHRLFLSPPAPQSKAGAPQQHTEAPE